MDPWRLSAENSDMIHQVILHVFIMVHVYLSFHSWWWHGWPSSWYLLFNFIQIIYIYIYIYLFLTWPTCRFQLPASKNDLSSVLLGVVALAWRWNLMESAHETKDKGWQSLLRQHNSLHLVETSAHQLVYERGTLTAAGTWLETMGFIGIHYMYLFFVSWNRKQKQPRPCPFSRNAQQFHAISLCLCETWLCKSLFLLGWILGISDEAEGLLSRLDAVWKAHWIMCGHASCSVPTYIVPCS